MQKVIHLVGENVKVELDGELDEALSITLGKRASARVRVRGHEIHGVAALSPSTRSRRSSAPTSKYPGVPSGNPSGPIPSSNPSTPTTSSPLSRNTSAARKARSELHDDDVAGFRELCARQIDPVAHSVRYHEALRPY